MYNSLFGKGLRPVVFFYIYFDYVYPRLFRAFCLVKILPRAERHIFQLLFCDSRRGSPVAQGKFSVCPRLDLNKKDFALVFADDVCLDVSEMDVSCRYRISLFFKIFCGKILPEGTEYSVIFHCFSPCRQTTESSFCVPGKARAL